MSQKEPTPWAASFAAKYIPMLAPHRCFDHPHRIELGGFHILPCDQGGTVIMTTDGHTLAAIRDPEGKCTEPRVLFLPDDFIGLCRTPKIGTVIAEDFDEIEISPPDELIPNKLILSHLCGHINGSDKDCPHPIGITSSKYNNLNHIDFDDYQVREESPLFDKWSNLLPDEDPELLPHLCISPRLMGKFSEITRPTEYDTDSFGLKFKFFGPDRPIVLTCDDPDLEFIGAIMPRRYIERNQDLSWAFTTQNKEQADEK